MANRFGLWPPRLPPQYVCDLPVWDVGSVPHLALLCLRHPLLSRDKGLDVESGLLPPRTDSQRATSLGEAS